MLMPVTVKVNFQLFPLWLYPLARNALKGFGLATNEKSAIVKANGNPAIVAALDNIANFTLQRHFGFPRESTGDQHDLITNLKTGVQLRFLFHLSAFSAGTMTVS